MNYIIEGIDNLGKSTLIRNIINHKGYHHVVHYSTPKELDCYKGCKTLYQKESYIQGFNTLQNSNRIIYDRFHLGEYVYGPMYRNTNKYYVFHMEKMYNLKNTRLVLLVTDDFSIIKDDGLSIDSSRQEEEQKMFVRAFQKSKIENKSIVYVNKNGRFLSERAILELSL